MSSRRAFTVSPLSLWVALLFLAVSGAHLIWAMNHPGWQTRSLIPYLLRFVGVPLIMAGVLGFVAWLIARKSDTLGNFIFAGVLLLMIASQLAIMAGVFPKGFTFPGSLYSLKFNPTPPPPGAATPAPSTNPTPAPPRPQTTPSVPPTAPPATSPATPNSRADPAISRTLDALAAELKADVDALWPGVQGAFTDWARPPRHDLRDVEERLQQAAALKRSAAAIGTRFRDFNTEAQQRLAAAGVNASIAMSESGHYSVHYNAMWRKTACDSVERACERAREEAEFLKQNFAKWSIDARGAITSSDLQVQGRARGLRSSLEFSIRNADALKKRLDEGR